jgi:hypothetical protein
MVNCVLISEEENHITDVQITVSNRSNDLFRVLKGTATFIGQWPELEVVIMKCRESNFQLLKNINKLPPPFQDEEVFGPILLIRMDSDSEPQDFTVQEFLEAVPMLSLQEQI